MEHDNKEIYSELFKSYKLILMSTFFLFFLGIFFTHFIEEKYVSNAFYYIKTKPNPSLDIKNDFYMLIKNKSNYEKFKRVSKAEFEYSVLVREKYFNQNKFFENTNAIEIKKNKLVFYTNDINLINSLYEYVIFTNSELTTLYLDEIDKSSDYQNEPNYMYYKNAVKAGENVLYIDRLQYPKKRISHIKIILLFMLVGFFLSILYVLFKKTENDNL